MVYVIFKKWFKALMLLLVATNAFSALSAVCYAGDERGLHLLPKRRKATFDELPPRPGFARPASPLAPTITMVPASRVSRFPAPEKVTPTSSDQVTPPAPSSREARTVAPTVPPKTAADKKLTPEAIKQHGIFKKVLKPFAVLSAKLRAIDPFAMIQRVIMRCMQWIAGLCGKRLMSDMSEDERQTFAPMLMPILAMGASFAAKPIVAMITPHTETIAEWLNSKFNWTGDKTGLTSVNRTSAFVGTFIKEYFMSKVSTHLNIGALKAEISAGTKAENPALTQEMHDAMIARFIILGGSVVHLLGDLHNLLYETDSAETGDRIDKYLQMSKSVMSLAHYTLFTYENTTSHAHALGDNMKKYIGYTVKFLDLAKNIQAALVAFKAQADQSGATPLLLNVLSGNKDIQAGFDRMSADAEAFESHQAGMMHLFGAEPAEA